ncbi:hypothetical protein [Thermomonospora cellulosilytica]|uniref:Uncharacterized protein n=1 Tax=Thermomonospora cellulosilytica TaxID=1411118 RepID=A0A7W3R9Z7_9ACTN|nr:hypothetical protein [Thermomonospora cellulosilytica]MBA9005878.1 hypothetical protein [Thermomonospora cellulosilytica]
METCPQSCTQLCMDPCGPDREADLEPATEPSLEAWTIECRLEPGQPRVRLPYPMDEATARLTHSQIVRYLDPGAVLVDLVGELLERMPLGSRVRHKTAGRTGVLLDVPCTTGPRGDELVIEIVLDGGSGWPTTWLADAFEPAPDPGEES